MKNVFLGTSFSGHVNYETGEVNPDFRAKVELMLVALRSKDFDVFCAVEHEGWVISDIPPEVGVREDLARIDESDAMLAYLPPDILSEGLQFELGYALNSGKPTILATELGTKIGYFNQGVVNLGLVKHIVFDSPESLATQIVDVIN